jgi:hypothetical protein
MRHNLVEGIVTAAFVYSPGFERNPRYGSPESDDGDTQRRSPYWGHLEQMLARGGSQVEWCAASHVENGGSRRHGVIEARRRTWVEVCA